MPITTSPTDITILVPQTLSADKVHIDLLTIDARGEVAGASNTPVVEIETRLYHEDANAVRTYASDPEKITTRDIYAVSARIPEAGQAMMAVFAAVAAWRAYRAARKVEMDSAEANAAATLSAYNALADEDPAKAQAFASLDAANALVNQARLAWIDPANPPVT